MNSTVKAFNVLREVGLNPVIMDSKGVINVPIVRNRNLYSGDAIVHALDEEGIEYDILTGLQYHVIYIQN